MKDVLIASLADAVPDTRLLGGKGASLARLVELGHRVPPGLVITTHAFASTMTHLGLAQAFEELAKSVAARSPRYDLGDRIHEELIAGRLPQHLRQLIGDEVARWRLWEITTGGLIVRSSATVEDSATHSFAGIFESIQVDDPTQLEATVMEVWGSVFSRRALTYAADSGVGAAPSMALVVQVFLDATRSGVMFTTFGGDRTLVEHVEGGCEKLVKGEVIPDRLWMARSTGKPDGDTAALSEPHVRSLAVLAADLEVQFGGPQDVEWCVYNEAVHLLQTRPVTAGFDQAARGDTTGAILTGVAASQGIGAGHVHLVFNIDQALELETGQVLVTPMTNPDMVVAMRNSAAIVTDVGGMICHAAIVSRELGLPCVVGTETATTTFTEGQELTVDGSSGAVYAGFVDIEDATAGLKPAEWNDVWALWSRFQLNSVPIVSTVAAIRSAPHGLERIVLRPDIDLRVSDAGLWVDLEELDTAELHIVIERYLQTATNAASEAGVRCLEVAIDRLQGRVAAAFAGACGPDVSVAASIADARPLADVLVVDGEISDRRQRLSPLADAEAAARDTIKFFGHQPGVRRAPMPALERRRTWWNLLPEYGRFHGEHATAEEDGDHDWLEVRPELVISALLKSLVQPGFEMVPRVLGFLDLPPLHIKWMSCRYHFRSQDFAVVWGAVVDATWDSAYMANLMGRVRASYKQLAEVLVLFPTEDDAFARLRNDEIVALITSWWPRWVEFFALCWFIQAQGDDILYPFIEETIAANLETAGRTYGDVAWPTAADMVLPTTSVLSGEYMASIGRLRQALLAHDLTSTQDAVAALDTGSAPEVAAQLAAHLADWHWMRDRDLLFEPWDTPQRVIETALQTEYHKTADYGENLRRNVFALAVHYDLAEASGRASALNHAVRFLHDLNVERENHHVLWLKYSYPLRRVFLEVERRLVDAGSLEPGDIWFVQAPELIATVRRLPEPMDTELVSVVKNRRRGFEHEAKMKAEDTMIEAEDDYL